MRRALLIACAALAVTAPVAFAASVSGRLVFCEGTDVCRYFPQPRLDVTFRAAPGERNELRILRHPSGVRIVDGAGIEAGEYCVAVNEHDARCGPPTPSGLAVAAFTGGRSDLATTRLGSLFLGPGRDLGFAFDARVFGGPGDDELRGAGAAATLSGGHGSDNLIAFGRAGQDLDGGGGNDFIAAGAGADRIAAGPGHDQIVGGRGRDEIAAGPGDDLIRTTDPDRDVVRCGRGNDRAFVSRSDRILGCERPSVGLPG